MLDGPAFVDRVGQAYGLSASKKRDAPQRLNRGLRPKELNELSEFTILHGAIGRILGADISIVQIVSQVRPKSFERGRPAPRGVLASELGLVESARPQGFQIFGQFQVVDYAPGHVRPASTAPICVSNVRESTRLQRSTHCPSTNRKMVKPDTETGLPDDGIP